jgi:hypothetical protein
MPSAFDGHKEEWEKLIEIAQEWYVELRYQRSYTAGWSGSLKLPIGLEGSVNQAASLASRQLSMPEIVDAYAKFVKLLTPWFVVVIGVDELDKIAAAEKAQEFLNEIKSVFGIDRCFYLISISDSAMSSFARRGLPVRDAFDSAFDEVIRVGYMTFEDTRQLLARRVIGLPRPVVAFCHAFSGGLPRDVIRACRALFNHAEGSRQRRLSEIVRLLIRADLGAKIEASTTYVLDAPPSPATAAALSALWKLQEAVAKDEDLESHYNALKAVADVSLLAGHAASTADIETSRRSAAETSADLAAYILYCSTLTSIFAAYPSGDEWVKADKRGYFAEVARFRRYLGISSQNAVTEIGSFRTSRSISPQLLLHVAAPPRVARPRKAVSKVPIPKRKPPITPARARQSKSTN